MTLSCLDAAQASPQAPALIVDGAVHTYEDLARLARERTAPGLGAHALVAEPTLDAIATFHASLASGRAVVLLHPQWTAVERERALSQVDLSFLDPDALAIVFTSGSSGRPKPVELSRAAFLASASASAQNLGWRDDDRWLLCLPFAHVGGLSILTRCLAARRAVALGRGDTEGVIGAVERDRVTLLSLVPAQLARLLSRTPRWDPPAHVRAMLVGGARCSAALLAEAADRRWPVLTTYGLTEACSQVTTQALGTVNRGELGSGPPLPGTEVRIVDGVIHVRGPTLLTRYLGDAAPRTPGDWFATEDLGELDERGNLHVLGRRSELIVTGGAKVMPAEVEEALRSWPEVADACVVGIPDPIWGERVAAALVLRGAGLNEGGLRSSLGARLAPYKLPRVLARVDTLPLNRNGKVDRARVALTAPWVEAPTRR